MTDSRQPGTELDPQPWPKNGLWFGLVVFGLVGLVLIGGALAAASSASARGRFSIFSSHRHWGHGSAHDPENAREHAEHAAEWILRYVDASDEQRQQVNEILGRSIDAIFPLTDRHRDNRVALVDLLRAPEIDREALEALRQSELQLADTASKELIDAVADLSAVLTPEQRAELIDLSDRFRR